MRKSVRILAALLALLLLTPLLPAPARAADSVQAKMDAYWAAVSAYGSPHWNGRIRFEDATLKAAVDRGDYLTGLTQAACRYTGKHLHENGCTSNTFGGGAQCHGFALYLCYVLFGNYPTAITGSSVRNAYALDDDWEYYARSIGRSFPGLQPGDMIRYYGVSTGAGTATHSAVVYDVAADGTITVIDCNRSSDRCGIAKTTLWATDSRRMTEDEFRSYYDRGQAYVCRSANIVRCTVITGAASGVTCTAARLAGTAQAENTTITEVGMYFGTSPEAMTRLGSDPFQGASTGMAYGTGETLSAGTTYCYQAYAVADGREFRGAVKTFTTAVPGVALSDDTLSLAVDTCVSLRADTAPDGLSVTWASSNPNVASVDADGMVDALSPGTAVITATVSSGGRTVHATCAVTVSAQGQDWYLMESDRVEAFGQIIHTYTYDGDGRLIAEDLREGSLGDVSNTIHYEYGYNAAGQLVRRTTDTGRATAYTHDGDTVTAVTDDGDTRTERVWEDGLLMRETNTYTFGTFENTYTYDAQGSLLTRTEDGETYVYDNTYENGRLIEARWGPEGDGAQYVITYEYDAAGNLTTERQRRVDGLGSGLDYTTTYTWSPTPQP